MLTKLKGTLYFQDKHLLPNYNFAPTNFNRLKIIKTLDVVLNRMTKTGDLQVIKVLKESCRCHIFFTKEGTLKLFGFITIFMLLSSIQ